MTARKIAAECGAYVNMNGVLFNTNVEFTAFVARIRAQAMEEAERVGYRQKIHLAGISCNGSSGGRPPIVVSAEEFTLTPPHRRCRMCERKAAIRAQEGKNTARTAGHPLSGRAQDENPAGAQAEGSAP